MLEQKSDQNLNKYTTIGIGGKIKTMYFPISVEQIVESIKLCNSTNTPYFVLAGGSNTVFEDDNLVYDQAIINLTKFDHLSYWFEGSECIINAESGVILQTLVDLAQELKLEGITGLNRVPGTIGGAVVGNAGAYGCETKDFVNSATVLDLTDYTIKELSNSDCNFTYRDSIFKHNKKYLVLRVTIHLQKSQNPSAEKSKYDEIATKRDAIYPKGLLSPGSLFKNLLWSDLPKESQELVPKDWVVYGNKLPVGKLLESLDCKGFGFGDVQMRPTHANIMINNGKGNFQEAVRTAQELKSKVKSKYKINIEPEVRFIPKDFSDFWDK
jgi:UDP-N-acetylenolpyruvoylglucosamine reductase